MKSSSISGTGDAARDAADQAWGDVKLDPEVKSRLEDLRTLITAKQRTTNFTNKQDTGTIALFAGPSGTGKTLAATVLARSLGLEVYRIDLSSVASKYIGETEKNLARIFDDADSKGAVLFFDEADSLFGKRSKVSDSHDRHANQEVSYLLQRIETYDGVVILSATLKSNIDKAFARRFHLTIDFTAQGS